MLVDVGLRRWVFNYLLFHWKHISIKTSKYEGWNFNSGNYLFTTDTK